LSPYQAGFVKRNAPEFKDDIEIATYNEEYADILEQAFSQFSVPGLSFPWADPMDRNWV
jgi:hypothetical protein